MTNFADRVLELRRIPARELTPHPDNWRLHGDEQRSALRYVLGRVGVANVQVAYEDPEWGLTLIDGHLRQSEIDQELPTVILDVTREEAKMLLLSLDGIAEMADRDTDKIRKLVKDTFDPEGDYLVMMKNMLGSISQPAADIQKEADQLLDSKAAVQNEKRYPLSAELNEQYDYVVILCKNVGDFNHLCDHLGVEKVQDYKSQNIGTGRIVIFDKVKDKLGLGAPDGV